MKRGVFWGFACLLATGGWAEEVRLLDPGFAELPETLVVGESNVVFRSADPLRPAVLSGGRRISGWSVGTDGVWRVTLPDVKAGLWNFSSLYVNGERRSRPSVPDRGFLFTASNAFVKAEENGKGSIGGFFFRTGDLRTDYANLQDVEVQVLHVWNTSRLRVGRIDGDASILVFETPRRGLYPGFDFTNRRYRLENVKEAFGRPGEWYLERTTGELSYCPRPGETPENAEVVAPRLTCLLRVANARNVRFENVVFAHQNLVTGPKGWFSSQAGYKVPAALTVTNSAEVVFDRCRIESTDGSGLEFYGGTTDSSVRDCELRDLGAGGIRIGPFGGNPPDGTGRIVVSGCHISWGGQRFPEGVGVLVGRSSYNRILRNEIDHLCYSGVSVGWDWNMKPTQAHHNEIAFNHIHDLGLKTMSDLSFIYLLGRAPGTTVHDNDLHDISCYTYGGIGIYADEGTSDVRIWNNRVRNATQAYHQNYGERVEVFSNRFENATTLQWDFRPARDTAGTTLYLHHNTFVWGKGGLMERCRPFDMTEADYAKWNPNPWDGYRADHNTYEKRGGNPPLFANGLSLGEWQRLSGQEVGSVVRHLKEERK